MKISVQAAAEVMKCSVVAIRKQIRAKHILAELNHTVGGRGSWEIFLESLPKYAQNRYWAQVEAERCASSAPGAKTGKLSKRSRERVEVEASELVEINTAFSEAPAWQKETIDERLRIVTSTAHMSASEALAWCAGEGYKLSARTLYRWRKLYAEGGKNALATDYGKRSGTSTIPDDVFQVFVTEYMKDSRPSARQAYLLAWGYANERKYKINPFPSQATFERRLKREKSESAIYMARFGQSAWNRKYGFYIESDFTKIRCGEIAVGDHMQFDCLVLDRERKPVRPWFTAWLDYKSRKFLGWDIHIESPCSDHVFTSFHNMCSNYGLPQKVLIDNGKDYRCKDFAGGRDRLKVAIDEKRASSLMEDLGITPYFALPYNAQRKPIERVFRDFHDSFERHLSGYTGTNVVKRPESLKKAVKNGDLMDFEEFRDIADSFIREVFNKRIFGPKAVHRGKSPDQIWEQENPVMRRAKPGALAVFLQRTSGKLRVGRNGVKDPQLGVTYWSEQFIGLIGTYVYLRRDLLNYGTAWVYACDDDRKLLCMATVQNAVHPFADTETTKAEFKEQMARKRSVEKAVRKVANVEDTMDTATKVALMRSAVVAIDEKRGYEAQPQSNIIKLQYTPLDDTARHQERLLREATTNSPVLPMGTIEERKSNILPLTRTQRRYRDKK